MFQPRAVAPSCSPLRPHMTRVHLTPLMVLLVASIAGSAGAQNPVDKTSGAKTQATTTATAGVPAPTPDSVAPDSLKPKKQGRFGGLMNNAKSVAGNKNVQAAVKAAGRHAGYG